jgi:hypothetical protein
MTEEQKKPVHPLIERALGMGHEGVEPFEFDDYAVEQLEDMLSEYFGDQDLIEAVIELLRLAFLLDQKGCKRASKQILIVASSAADALLELKKENNPLKDKND